jgi:hypothetical protein
MGVMTLCAGLRRNILVEIQLVNSGNNPRHTHGSKRHIK